jgi:trimeric autotransporter adhesin
MGLTRMVGRGGFLALGLLAGCGGVGTIPETNMHSSVGVSGRVHGGQQPVVGATIQLYTVGTSGDGSASTPLLTQTVTSDANGNFNITGLYSCSSATQVYLLATGGNPGAGVVNPDLAMMTALGPCSELTSSMFIMVNELTTVAAVGALSPYMTSSTAIGSGSGDAAALANAFTLAGELVNTTTGLSPGNNVPKGYAAPTAEMNTLADVVASCVNSTGGVAGDSSVCGQLFAATTPNGGTAPVDTIAALLNLANNPTLNTGTIYGLMSATPPFQPTLASPPPDFRTRLTPSSPGGYVLQVEPTSLSFPSTPVSSTSGSQVVYLGNSGSAAIALGSIGVTGPNAADFSSSSSCGGSLAAGSSCMVTVTITPSGAGVRNAYLSVASSSPDSPQYVSLAGSATSVSGSGPHAVLSPGYLENYFSGSGLTRNVTLSNTGNAPLSITSVSTTTPYFVATSQCGPSLAAGASCTIAVQDLAPLPGLGFEAFPSEMFTDELTVVTNDPSSPADVLLWSNTAGTWSTSNLMFPPVTDSAATTLTLSGPTLIQSYPVYSPTLPGTPSISGANAGDFAVSPSCLSSSPPGYCNLTVTFTPTAMGTRTASLVLDSSGSYIPISGTKVASVPTTLTFSPASVSLGGFNTTVAMTVTNPSSSTVTLSSITTTAGFSQTNNCGSSIFAQSVCTITVLATSTIAGGQQGVLTVNGSFGSESIALANLIDPILQFGTWATGSTTTLTKTVGSAGPIGYQTIFNAGIAGSCVEREGGCTISFAPSVSGIGPVQTDLTLTDLAGAQPYPSFTFQAEWTGVAAGPLMTFDMPDGLTATVGSSQSYAVSVYNSGTTAMNISSIAMSGANASDFSPAATCVNTFAVGANCVVEFTVTPGNVGLRTATMTLTDGNSGQSFSVPVSVLGVPPAPVVSPTTVTFPVTAVNDISVPMSFTVTPYNNAAVTAVLQTGFQASEFSLTKASCAQGESPCIITGVFNPTTVGSAMVYVTVASSGSSAIATLSGYGGVGPIGAVSATLVTFASRPVGSMSVAQTVTLTNTGDEGFYPIVSAVSGTNASEFSMSSTCSGILLAAGSNCVISTSFDPTTAGSKSASFQVNGNVNGINAAGLPVTISLSGAAF